MGVILEFLLVKFCIFGVCKIFMNVIVTEMIDFCVGINAATFSFVHLLRLIRVTHVAYELVETGFCCRFVRMTRAFRSGSQMY